ncbi:MAG: hypothetical protein GY794_15810 [bacterium]|nr:hypothetical protein [bacterium]
MMKKFALAVLIATSLFASGCGLFGKSAPVSTVQTNTVEGCGMRLTIEMPKRRYIAGESINLRIIVCNTSKETIAFECPTSALYKVTLLRNVESQWRQVNQYPQAAMGTWNNWELKPGQSVKYDQVIPVERDWPMGEPLKLVAELVGAPKPKCPMIISATVNDQK